MDSNQHYGATDRQLAHLKILSRLLGHELHSQTGPRISLSREEVVEIQASLDLFIEDNLRQRGGGGMSMSLPEAAPARIN